MSICSEIYQAVCARLPEMLALRGSRQAKPDGSYVTGADLLAQEVIVDRAAALDPGLQVISEEASDGRTVPTGAAGCLVVDPLDGTENFTSGLKEWGISLSLYRAGEHVESLIGLPELGLRLTTGERSPEYTSRLHGLSSSLDPATLGALPPGREYRMIGCAVYNFYNVVVGSFASFENPRGAEAWDILAGLNLARERGLHVTLEGHDYDGRFLPADRKYRFRVQRR